MLTPQNIMHIFQIYKLKVNSNNNKRQEKAIPCFVVAKNLLDVSLNTIEQQLNQQGVKLEKNLRVNCSATNQETGLIKILTKYENKAKKQS